MSVSGVAPRAGLRGDIEGMRAVAVLLVLLYHARVPGISGGFAGVDVFFVISGFLITSLLLREVRQHGSISIIGFYARRARRLLPAATVVLIATGMLGYAVLPAAARGDLGRDIVASTFYVVNWALARRSVDYLAEDATPSAVQHYWSLSVEEQFYLLWPLLMIGAVLLAAKTRTGPFRMMGLVLGVITLTSLLWSVIDTSRAPDTAYFVTTTRVWELGIGAMLAFAVPRLRGLSRSAAEILALLGVAAVAACAVLVTASTPWPGSAALLPVLGTAAVVAAGCSGSTTRTGSVLGAAPLRFLGGISYSLYLWHWPMLVYLDEVRPGTGLRGRMLVMALAILLAWLTKIAVEDPIRFRSSLAGAPLGTLTWAGATMTASAALALTLVLSTPTLGSDLPDWALGARALTQDPASQRPEVTADPSAALTATGRVYPDPELATEDVPQLYDDGCQVQTGVAEPATCDYGDTESNRVVAVVGDSKVGQWLPALDVIGVQEGWLIRTYTKSRCSWTDATLSVEGQPYDDCSEWGKRVLADLTGPDKPMVVVTSSGSDVADGGASGSGSASLVEGYLTYWRQLQTNDVEVIALADNPGPGPGKQVYTCVGDNPQDYTVCNFPASEGRGTPSLRAATQRLPGVRFIDLSPWLCPDQVCSAVIGNVLVYRQGSHVTAAYAETMAQVLRFELVSSRRAAPRGAHAQVVVHRERLQARSVGPARSPSRAVAGSDAGTPRITE
ncbi:MAG: acyltransferase family protein [Ornithinimicrobium sp.]|uniref:acyltransferase family protein n=1 Tax=Ornithinimicrobium sp. TaxID=1977084 RepID=UPI003D9AC9D4